MPTEAGSLKVYVRTFGLLLLLLGLTVGVSYVNLGAFNTAAALLISVLKALLIILFFMEVRYSHPITWLFAGAAFLWLVILLTLILGDYFTRPWTATDWREGTGSSNHIEFNPSRP